MLWVGLEGLPGSGDKTHEGVGRPWLQMCQAWPHRCHPGAWGSFCLGKPRPPAPHRAELQQPRLTHGEPRFCVREALPTCPHSASAKKIWYMSYTSTTSLVWLMPQSWEGTMASCVTQETTQLPRNHKVQDCSTLCMGIATAQSPGAPPHLPRDREAKTWHTLALHVALACTPASHVNTPRSAAPEELTFLTPSFGPAQQKPVGRNQGFRPQCQERAEQSSWLSHKRSCVSGETTLHFERAGKR